ASAPEAGSMREALARLSQECDLLLIDTSGRSPRDPEGIAEIQRLLSVCPDLDIHLVLAANARVRDQALALDRFSVLPIRHLAFTKLDETTRRGGVFTVALKASRPVSYLGTGQEVPDDLEEATVAGLTEAIATTLQKESVHA
ncbi:MAG: flagellar GTP-binding protein, partial [Candidatus Eisenbacteria bacterium]|nr:flagellar GTP-binding protein [Candidatus Eisenbacteria bacterium]